MTPCPKSEKNVLGSEGDTISFVEHDFVSYLKCVSGFVVLADQVTE